MEHNLKYWPEYFRAVKTGAKPFEIRKWDRPYAVGDCLVLQEYDPKTSSYTGDSIVRQITYLLDLTYLPGDDRPHHSGYVALGITPPVAADAIETLLARAEKAEAERDALLDEIAALREENRWIPVSEPPEKYLEDGELYNFQTVLVSCENGAVMDAIWCGSTEDFRRPDLKSWYQFTFDTNPVTHWRLRPLPAPPNTKEE